MTVCSIQIPTGVWDCTFLHNWNSFRSSTGADVGNHASKTSKRISFETTTNANFSGRSIRTSI
jgi:hypothetical protein